MPQLNQRDAIHYIANRREFTASALSGGFKVYAPDTGRLNDEEIAKIKETTREAGGAYFVYSYGTPIAWFTPLRGWYVVEQKFTVTTSKHQNYVRRAIAESLQGAN